MMVARLYLMGALMTDHCRCDLADEVFRGGKNALVARNGLVIRKALDQEETDNFVKALKRSCDQRRPVVLLADRRYSFFPWEFGTNVNYVVLGLYYITRAWGQ